jgi:hypothetical protein
MGQDRTSPSVRAFKSKNPILLCDTISVKTEKPGRLDRRTLDREGSKFIRRAAAGNFAAAIGTDRS